MEIHYTREIDVGRYFKKSSPFSREYRIESSIQLEKYRVDIFREKIKPPGSNKKANWHTKYNRKESIH
jgi:hypothetical protein